MSSIDFFVVAVVAGFAAFTTGLAGFGTGLVAAGVWLHFIPARYVPPLVAIVSVFAQLTSLSYIRRDINWHALVPYLGGAVVGIPLGVFAQQYATQSLLRQSVGLFLVAFTLFELIGKGRFKSASPVARHVDPVIGTGGGFLGGFAGLSAPLPVVWLQLRGGAPSEQRAIYQPFSLIVLSGVTLLMGVVGQIPSPVFEMTAWCLPAVLVGAWLGTYCYTRMNQVVFRRLVLILLLASGLMLVGLL